MATVVILVAGIAFIFFRFNPLRTFPERANEATALVAAAYRFRDDCGIWPEELSELIPEYTPGIPADWEYIWGGYDENATSFLLLRGPLHMKLVYEFPSADKTTAGWRATCEGDPLIVNVRQGVPVPVPHSDDERRRNAMHVLRNRMQREPESRDHRAAFARYAES
jgi:hypothetical protein